MKKVTVLLIVSVFLTLFTSTLSATEYDISKVQIMTLFLSQCTSDGENIAEDFDFKTISTAADGIAIVPYYAISVDGEWHNMYNIAHNGLTGYEALAELMVDIIKRLVSFNADILIWPGTPGIDSVSYTATNDSTKVFISYTDKLRALLGEEIWENNIAGIYYNQESVYGTVNYKVLTLNKEIEAMSEYSDYIHKMPGKTLLWIPYYGYGDNYEKIIKNIAAIVNTTDIFDAVFMQTAWITEHGNNEVYKNFEAISASMRDNTVYARDMSVLFERKANRTFVGTEIELNTYESQYFEPYIETYSDFAGKAPIMLYWQGNLDDAVAAAHSFFVSPEKEQTSKTDINIIPFIIAIAVVGIAVGFFIGNKYFKKGKANGKRS